MLVRYKCGCIGLPKGEDGYCLIFYDHSMMCTMAKTGEYFPSGKLTSFFLQELTYTHQLREYKPLSIRELEQFQAELLNAVNQASDFRKIRQLLK